MKRIVILGDGYQAGKAARIVQRIHPKADLVWIADTDDHQYPLSILALLLNSGARVQDWPGIKARIKVGFERYRQDINLFPRKVKRIRIDSGESEISFLTDRGTMSHSFDKALVFSPQIVQYPGQLNDNKHVWPSDPCVRYLVNNWETIENPVVAGFDMSLVQALVTGGKKFVWVRTGNIFSEQVQHFLDHGLEGLGVKIIKTDPDTGLKHILNNETGMDRVSRPVFLCGHCKTDYARLEAYGLKNPDIMRENSSDPDEKNVFIIDPSGPVNEFCPGFSPETQLARSLDAVESALTGAGHAASFPDMMFLNMGILSAARVGLDATGAQEKGYTPEFALIHGTHGISANKPYLLHMVMDKQTQKIIGMEAVGERAHEWANLAACHIRNNSTIRDVSGGDINWPDPTVNPFTRCARMLENKTRPGILGISPAELKQSALEGAEFIILDVRSTDEFARGRLPGAGNIPLNQLKKRIMEIPRFTPIVLYSMCSGRAYEAARLLKGMGAKQLYVLDGGYGLYNLDKDLSSLSRKQPGNATTCPGC